MTAPAPPPPLRHRPLPAPSPAPTVTALPPPPRSRERTAGQCHDARSRTAVAVTPPLPNRRNAELFLLGFAAVITTVALLLVEANQEQGLHWDLAQYAVAYLALFLGAHLAVRRFAPYADPLLLPVVALLNGLGLVMIHRLDLADGRPTSRVPGRPDANQQMLWTCSAFGVLPRGALPARPPHAGALRLRVRAGRPGAAGHPGRAAPLDVRAERREDLDQLPGFSIQPAEFSKILLLIFFAAVLVAKRRCSPRG